MRQEASLLSAIVRWPYLCAPTDQLRAARLTVRGASQSSTPFSWDNVCVPTASSARTRRSFRATDVPWAGRVLRRSGSYEISIYLTPHVP
jgi:hypothetical protein